MPPIKLGKRRGRLLRDAGGELRGLRFKLLQLLALGFEHAHSACQTRTSFVHLVQNSGREAPGKLAGNVAEPILTTLYSIPKVVLYPLVLLCFGLGISAKIAFGVMHGLIPITLFSMNAIRQMKPVYRRTSQVMRLSPAQSAFTVIMPAILPEIISGVRLGFSLTLLGVLIGEMFASQRGLGFLLTSAINLGQIDTIMAIALLLTVFAVTCNALMMRFDRRLTHR